MTTVYIYLVICVLGMLGVPLCGPGLYGEYCDKHCNVKCRAHVDKQRYCDKDTGDCSLGCVPERWGSQCKLRCSKNCVDRVCVQQTGLCSKGCTENYRGHLCEEYIETRPETLTPVQPRNDPPEETHSYKAVDTVVVATIVVATVFAGISVAVFVVDVFKFRHRKSGTSTAELRGADGEVTKILYQIRAADSHDEKTKSLEQSKTERVHVDDNEAKDIYSSQDISSKACEVPLMDLDPQDAGRRKSCETHQRERCIYTLWFHIGGHR